MPPNPSASFSRPLFHRQSPLQKRHDAQRCRKGLLAGINSKVTLFGLTMLVAGDVLGVVLRFLVWWAWFGFVLLAFVSLNLSYRDLNDLTDGSIPSDLVSLSFL
ncbi:hypothetical protein E2542_SST17177 [Spatholobus suberectus]|nr:hypothetical protein E2542_SST17177 [Spatholobus suberectus]